MTRHWQLHCLMAEHPEAVLRVLLMVWVQVLQDLAVAWMEQEQQSGLHLHIHGKLMHVRRCSAAAEYLHGDMLPIPR